MKFSVASIFAVLATTVSAIPAFTNSAFDVTPGSTFTLTWHNATGPVTITLVTGSSADLKKVQVIDSGDSSDSFTWTVPTTLVSGTYAFEIADSTGPNYSKQFQLTGTGSASASASTASSTAATSSSSAASSSSDASSSSSTSSSSSSSTSSSSSSKTTHLTTTAASNSTTTATKTSTTGTKATTSPTTVPANTNNSPQAKSPLAFVLVTIAALLYFN
ncbi:uncharacterized protein SPSK_09721 [Sporothrix schenckii 1099-18]|uniref:Extracellular matrix protein n=2 Tax=Sporothrix schenckii TaxID=29908 RepID=U7Q5G5_SPOS1|nr:uncharacterized protein SPSK_09721 [Sporothrix schenckii 1099-18]ERT03083.1 hypothetical protein HMPREF1624_01388 [Sporothrix schenckii ATCC 58251]KJR84514.1 hypothetical protein SPSK_09721 [Sporothrix schenckii 1099-18]